MEDQTSIIYNNIIINGNHKIWKNLTNHKMSQLVLHVTCPKVNQDSFDNLEKGTK